MHDTNKGEEIGHIFPSALVKVQNFAIFQASTQKFAQILADNPLEIRSKLRIDAKTSQYGRHD